ncbi:MAG: uroporphyrinogen-III C-methyltransferase [Pseudomonadales bacterium]|nr:uroporphyrinogen-III C-methyltransferase [Pseudomonadales bacterium]
MTTKPSSDESSETDEPSKVVGPRGTWTARISLLVATIALGAASFLGYELIYLQPIERQAEQTQAALSSLEQQVLQELDIAITKTERSVMELGEDLKTQNLSVQEDLRNAVMDSLATAQTNRPTTPRQWRLSEAAFLLRMANYWLQFEGDVQVALKTLQRADEVLQAVQSSLKQDEYDLLPVRSALAQEILALRQVKPVDVQGIFLRLQALADSVPAVGDALQLDMTSRGPEISTPVTSFAAIAQELEKFVRITDLSDLSGEDGAAAASTLGPEDILTSRRAVIAAIERAQIAALRRQGEAYRASITDAVTAAGRLASPSDPQLRQYLELLSAMRDEPLTASVPKISGSLGELTRLMESY